MTKRFKSSSQLNQILSHVGSRHSAFTLIETTIVLALLGTTLLVGIYHFPSRQRQLTNEKMFWEQFNTTWQQTIYLASAQHKSYFVHFDSGNREIRVDTRAAVGGVPARVMAQIPFPETIEMRHTEQHEGITISDKGHPTPRTFKFKSTLNGETAVIFQFGWGAYRLVKSG